LPIIDAECQVKKYTDNRNKNAEEKICPGLSAAVGFKNYPKANQYQNNKING